MMASFVIGFHSARIDNLLQTLRFLIKNHEEIIVNSQLVMVCQDNIDVFEFSDNSIERQQFKDLDSIRAYFKTSDLTSLNLQNMHLPLVTNTGIDLCDADKIVILESDRILPSGYFASVLNDLKEGICITCKDMKKLTKIVTDEEIRSGNFEFKNEYRDETNQIGIKNMWSGNTAIWKSDYYKVGKMDEAYIGYGWADSDMTNRFTQMGIQSIYRKEIELHLWHPKATYGKGDQKKQFIDNGLYFCKKWNVELPLWFRKEIATHRGMLF